jgi:hypothetical protein
MRLGETLSLIVILPNEQRIKVSEAIVRWSRGQEFAVETMRMAPQTQARLQQYVKRLVQRMHPITGERHDASISETIV